MDARWLPQPQADFFLANFFCQSCGQPVKLDPSLLDHRTVGDAIASLVPVATDASDGSAHDPLHSDQQAGGAHARHHHHHHHLNHHRQQISEGLGVRRSSFLARPPAAAAVDGALDAQQAAGVAILATPPMPVATTPNEASAAPALRPPPAATMSAAVAGFVGAVASSLSTSPGRAAAPAAPSQPQSNSAAVLSPGDAATTTDRNDDRRDNHRGNLSHRLKVASRLFDVVSRVADADHPLCQECADELMTKLERRLADARGERDAYASFLADLKAQEAASAPTAAPMSPSLASAGVISPSSLSACSSAATTAKQPTDADIAALRHREENALATLHDLERENDILEQELHQAEKDLKATEDMEQAYWQDVNDLERELSTYQTQLESINLKYDQASSRLDALTKANVYTDAFRIWHDGPFGMINGLRLGRLPIQQVEWSEINAAMGHTVLLLDTLANKLGFTFTAYRLIPMGSFSRIERTDGDKAVYELYGSNDITSMLFLNRRFDYGLVAFLQCLQQLGDYAERQDNRFRLPYRIVKDRIGDVSIRMQFNQDEAWTKALKYTLIDVKWMLAFCCSRLES